MSQERKNHYPLAYDIKGLVKASGRGRSTIFEEIGAGRLVARKAGGKTIVLYEDAVAWLQALPVREPTRSACAG
jgi:hypothetical protein